MRFRDADMRNRARETMLANLPDLAIAEREDGQDLLLVATMKPEAIKRNQEYALKQNITTLHNRINELGVAEPVIQQQGAERIVVQLPGVQDAARQALDRAHRHARDPHGGRGIHEPGDAGRRGEGPVPFGTGTTSSSQPLLSPPSRSCSPATGSPTPSPASTTRRTSPRCTCASTARARASSRKSRARTSTSAAILLIEKGKGEVITAPVIRSEIPGGRVQISGPHDDHRGDRRGAPAAGSLAAPMEIVEERTVGPEPGRATTSRRLQRGDVGIHRHRRVHVGVLHGVRPHLLARAGGQPAPADRAALPPAGHAHLPGIAAIALTLGMAIDANVLINERIKEELRGGATPQAAIAAGMNAPGARSTRTSRR